MSKEGNPVKDATDKTKGKLKSNTPPVTPGPDVTSINGVNPAEAKDGYDASTYKPQDRPSSEEKKSNINYTIAYDSESYPMKKDDGSTLTASAGKQPDSAFNDFSLYNFKGTALGKSAKGMALASYNQISFDDSVYTTPTITNIVEKTSALQSKGYTYKYADFALCKYLGKIPNNYMLTLRRFPFPVPDDIIAPTRRDKNGNILNDSHPDIARAITWMSEATGNKLEDILKFDYNYEWKDQQAQIQEMNTQTAARKGKFGSFVENSTILRAVNAGVNGKNAQQTKTIEANSGMFDPLKDTYPNHVFGPYNSIRNMMIREGGMKFNQEFSIKFQYEIKQIGNTNPKVLFMDQFANMLALTYSNAPFWGGETRWLGGGPGSIGSPLGDLSKLQAPGADYLGFFKGVMGQLGDMASAGLNDLKKGLSGSKIINNILGGALMDLFNSPQGGMIANALLTGESTGQWHLTVGNPLNPMAVIGNLICTKTSISFKGGLGVDDFPEILEVEISLKPGRPRDKGEIESMFNSGRGRFYLVPKGGSDINKVRDSTGYKGDTVSTPEKNLKTTNQIKATSKKVDDAAFDEYKKLANG
jgi:hypothetical protein